MLALTVAAYTPEEVRALLDAAALGSLDVTQVTDRHLDVFGRVNWSGWLLLIA
jgi:hypothetical protein